MGSKKNIPTHVRSQMIVLADMKCSHALIANKLGTSKSAVTKALNRVKETGTFKDRSRTGRPVKTTQHYNRIIARYVKKIPHATSTEIAAKFPSEISTRTIRRRLQKTLNFRTLKPQRKPLLNSKQIAKRLKFCHQYKDWTSDDWSKVMFSDESTFHQFRDEKKCVRVPIGHSPLNPKYTVKTIKHSPSVMIWGCFSLNGRGSLYFLPKGETMKAKNYLAMLKEKLPHFMQILDCNIFMQDSAPCHTAKIVLSWLKSNYNVLEWPGNSPDLNPIENLWTIVKNKVATRNSSSMPELINNIKRAWTMEINVELCQNLIKSMPNRIQCVIKNKGYPSKY